MNTAVINFKTDAKTKKELQAFAAKIGIPVSAVLNAQIRQTLLDQRLNVSSEPAPRDQVMQEIIDAVADYRAKKNISRKLKSGKEVRGYLEAL